MPETLVHTMALENGCTLNLYDASRKLVGDRWQVTLAARMEIDVRNALAGTAEPDAGAVAAALGETVIFEKKLERVFIDDAVKVSLFDQMLSSFVQNTAPYLAHPEFARRFVARQYAEHQKKASWYKE
jgi:hypothetical protein